jgi:Ca-activated chloride channel homolog
MTTCDEIEADKRSEQPGLVRLVLFFVMQGVAVILVGFAALFLSFEPVWSAERLQSNFLKPGDARAGSLLLKIDEGYADAARLGVDVDLTVSGPPFAPALRRSSVTRRRTGSRLSMSTRCRRAAPSIR